MYMPMNKLTENEKTSYKCCRNFRGINIKKSTLCSKKLVDHSDRAPKIWHCSRPLWTYYGGIPFSLADVTLPFNQTLRSQHQAMTITVTGHKNKNSVCLEIYILPNAFQNPDEIHIICSHHHHHIRFSKPKTYDIIN